MDQCTHEVRAEYWKGIIKACGQRPAGQSAKCWMDENGICEQSYYYWQRKLREQAYGLIKESAAVPAVPEKPDIICGGSLHPAGADGYRESFSLCCCDSDILHKDRDHQ